jgi:hypothetical protein
VDVSFVDNTGTPRFVIVWSLVKEDGQWKLDAQISAQRETELQPYSSPAPTAAPTASPSAPTTASGAGVPTVRKENEPSSHLVKASSRASTTVSITHYRAIHEEEGLTSSSDAHETGYGVPKR